MPEGTPHDTSEQEFGEQSADNGGRQRSTIAFPYGSLKDAEEIAEALHKTWGGTASPDQLAGSVNSTPRSGTFRVKVATTKTFRVVSVSRKKIALTDLGRRLQDPATQEEARIEAFLNVPLFKAIYSEYEGHALPPDPGLEQKIADLGVSSKQASRARQALQRSAERAGFFSTTKGRLIRPAPKGNSGKANESRGEANVNLSQSGSVAVPLSDLWLTLLDQGESWSAEKIQDFVKAARELRKIMADDA